MNLQKNDRNKDKLRSSSKNLLKQAEEKPEKILEKVVTPKKNLKNLEKT